MEELKCPKCGSIFTVNEADYASIVSQVKTDEFHREIERRLSELNEKHAAETDSRSRKWNKNSNQSSTNENKSWRVKMLK